MASDASYRSGFVTLAGRSNVGKSTLLNRLVGHKVAIVTPRPQTTRRRIAGICTDGEAQVIFVDTPGLHEAQRALNKRMLEEARRSLREGDLVVAVVEAAAHLSAEERTFLNELRHLRPPQIVAVNKIDLLRRPRMLPMLQQCQEAVPESEIVPVSALTGENTDTLLRLIKQKLPAGPQLMESDEYTTESERSLAEEIVREKIFLAMRQEIPFSTAVRVEQFSDDEARGLARIAAVIVVERDSHKGMLIGTGGRALKAIGTQARLELEEVLGRRVFLELFVKVERNWTRDPRRVAELIG